MQKSKFTSFQGTDDNGEVATLLRDLGIEKDWDEARKKCESLGVAARMFYRDKSRTYCFAEFTAEGDSGFVACSILTRRVEDYKLMERMLHGMGFLVPVELIMKHIQPPIHTS